MALAVTASQSPRILERVAHPFSSISSWPRNRTRVSCIVGRFFTNWAITEVSRLGEKTRGPQNILRAATVMAGSPSPVPPGCSHTSHCGRGISVLGWRDLFVQPLVVSKLLASATQLLVSLGGRRESRAEWEKKASLATYFQQGSQCIHCLWTPPVLLILSSGLISLGGGWA